MHQRVLLAGASGAIGARPIPLLLQAGYDIVGTTRSEEKAKLPQSAGITPIVVDVFDRTSLTRAALAARPQIVIHQLTDLPRGVFALDAASMAEAISRNARIRREGTRNLAAAIEAGAERLIAQSVAWVYAPGPEPHAEDDPLDVHATGTQAVTVGGVVDLEPQLS